MSWKRFLNFKKLKGSLSSLSRTHPEVAGDNAPFSCEICDKKFTVKTAYSQHKLAHEAHEATVNIDDDVPQSDNTGEMVVKVSKKKKLLTSIENIFQSQVKFQFNSKKNSHQVKKQKIKQEEHQEQQQMAAGAHQITTITIPSSQAQTAIKLAADQGQLTAAQLAGTQPIHIQMSQPNSVQQPTQILQVPLQSIVSSSQNQITYNQTTTQSTKTTYFKAVSSGDGNAQLYPIPSNLILQNPTFIQTASGELQVAGGFKLENNWVSSSYGACWSKKLKIASSSFSHPLLKDQNDEQENPQTIFFKYLYKE